jgi:regulatory protein
MAGGPSAAPAAGGPAGAPAGGAPGADIPGADAPEVQAPVADALEVVREMALRRLERRAYARGELKAALVAKGADPAVCDTLLNRFEEVGLVDDAAYAAAWVESRHGARHLSRFAVVQELRRKGLADEVIDAAVAAVDGESELSAAEALAESKRRALAGLDRDTAYRRLAGTLARKGYGPGVVNQVVQAKLAEWGVDQ